MKNETNLIQVGHSPDPDDAFMFYGIQAGKVNTFGYTVDHVVEDIESLNQRAMKGELEVTAISLHCYAHVQDKYSIMSCGVSMGDDYGPILVAKEGVTLESLKGKKIAAPGPLTTAALVAQIILPGVELIHRPFDEIMPAVASGELEAGILIHEGQLTYKDSNLVNLVDFGKWWKEKYKLPLPLGVDVIRRDLPEEKARAIQSILKESIEHALANREPALEYALQWGRGLSNELNDKFVGMYVNDFTVDFGDEGREAVRCLLREGHQAGLIPGSEDPIFADQDPSAVKA